MRVRFTTPRWAYLPRMAAGLVMLLALAIHLVSALWFLFQSWWWRRGPLDDVGMATPEASPLVGEQVKLLLAWILVLLGAAALGWLLLPPLRGYELAADPTAIRLGSDGTAYRIPWDDVASVTVTWLPVPRRRWSVDRRAAWHLEVVAGGYPQPLRLPLHTFRAQPEEIATAVQSLAPEEITVELGAAAGVIPIDR